MSDHEEELVKQQVMQECKEELYSLLAEVWDEYEDTTLGKWLSNMVARIKGDEELKNEDLGI